MQLLGIRLQSRNKKTVNTPAHAVPKLVFCGAAYSRNGVKLLNHQYLLMPNGGSGRKFAEKATLELDVEGANIRKRSLLTSFTPSLTVYI